MKLKDPTFDAELSTKAPASFDSSDIFHAFCLKRESIAFTHHFASAE